MAGSDGKAQADHAEAARDEQPEPGWPPPGSVKSPLLPLWAAVLVLVAFLGFWAFVEAPKQREHARRINCAGCMKNFGLAVRMYSGDFDECFPPDFSVLITQDYLTTLKVYTCPSTDTRTASTFEEFQTGEHCDYLYFGKGLTEDCRGYEPTKTILGCDKPGNHRGYFTVWFSHGMVKGYFGESIESIADENGFFLPGYNMPEKVGAD